MSVHRSNSNILEASVGMRGGTDRFAGAVVCRAKVI